MNRRRMRQPKTEPRRPWVAATFKNPITPSKSSSATCRLTPITLFTLLAPSKSWAWTSASPVVFSPWVSANRPRSKSALFLCSLRTHPPT
ncbi:hypothetical protein VTN96DRAFT_4662 [Rasamsonia emersonii]